MMKLGTRVIHEGLRGRIWAICPGYCIVRYDIGHTTSWIPFNEIIEDVSFPGS
jgi:hypothetical protein